MANELKLTGIAIPKSPVFLAVLAVGARALLDVTYILIIYPEFSHGYESYELTWDSARYAESWLIYIILLLATPAKISKPSDFYVLFIYFFLLCPILSLYSLSNASRIFVYVVAASFLILTFVRSVRFDIRDFWFLRESHLKAVCIVGIAMTAGWMIMARGTEFSLSLADVYEYRPEASEALDVSLMAYVNIWSYKVFGPILLAFGLVRRSTLLFLFALAFHCVAFAYTQHKSVLFYPVIVGATVWLFGRSRPALMFPIALAGLSLLALWMYEYDLVFWVSILFRRMTFLVANITFYYMNYFDSVGYVWWSNNILSAFLEYPYGIAPAALVADSFGLDANFNNGFVSTGYMHGGVIGVILYSLLVGMLLSLLDALGRKHGSTMFVVTVTLVPMHSMILSADLLTSLLSHGLALALGVLVALQPFRLPLIPNWHVAATHRRVV